MTCCKSKRKKELEEELEALKDLDNIKISDHAYKRYFERVEGVDMDKVAETIKARIGENNKPFRIGIRNKTIATVI